MGRIPKTTFEKYRPIYMKYRNRKLTAIEAAHELGINVCTFYKYRDMFGKEYGREQLPPPIIPESTAARRAEDENLACRWNMVVNGSMTRETFCEVAGKPWRALRERIAVLRVRHPKWGIKYLNPERDSFEDDTGREKRQECFDKVEVLNMMEKRDPGWLVEVLDIPLNRVSEWA